MTNRLISILKRDNKTIREGVVTIDIERDGKRYIGGKNPEKRKIFIKIRDSKSGKVLRQIVKPYETFTNSSWDYTLLVPFVKMLKRGIQFNDFEDYRSQFESYTQPTWIYKEEEGTIRAIGDWTKNFEVIDRGLAERVASELDVLKEKANGTEVLPEILNLINGTEPIGNLTLQYAELSGVFGEPGHKGFALIVDRNLEHIGYISKWDEMGVVQYSPKKRMLWLENMSDLSSLTSPRDSFSIDNLASSLYTEGGMCFSQERAQDTFMTSQEIAKWWVNKAEFGLTMKDKILEKLKIVNL